MKRAGTTVAVARHIRIREFVIDQIIDAQYISPNWLPLQRRGLEMRRDWALSPPIDRLDMQYILCSQTGT